MQTPTRSTQHTKRTPFFMLESVRAEDSLVRLLILSCPVLTRYLPRPKIRKERNLLQDKNAMAEGEDETEVRSGALIIGSPLPDKQVADTIVSYWHQVCSSNPTADSPAIDTLPTESHFGSCLRCHCSSICPTASSFRRAYVYEHQPGPGRTYSKNRCCFDSWKARRDRKRGLL